MKPKVKPRAGDGSGAAGGAQPRKKLKPKDYEKQLPSFPDRMKENESLMTNSVLTINGGSSSVKFAVFGQAEPPVRMLSGEVERIGLRGAVLGAKGADGRATTNEPVAAADLEQAGERLIDWLLEWNYGRYEGRRSVEIHAEHPDWRLFRDGCPIRVLAARWLGLEPAAGRYFLLSTASLSALSCEHTLSEPAIRLWDDTRHVGM